ncbi:hypothetical protein AGMMS49944_02190 [Spirochaetia bacterium]|nr:hypothetical protein AGMMS49944_02190 [Spirochaetia bacterium]
MNDVAVSAGKSAFYSFFHNHSEHSVLATKIEALEKKEFDREFQEFHELRGEFKQVKENVSGIEKKLDQEIQEFHELKGEFKELKGEVKELKGEVKELKGEVKQVKEDVSEIKDELKSYRDTMSGLRELLVQKGIRRS